jgi:hypothetical protein
MDPLKYPEQFAYDQDIAKARASAYKTINNDSRDIIIDFKNSRLSTNIEKSLSPITELGIQLFDQEKMIQELEAVDLKYENDLKGRRVGKRGAAGGPGEIVIFFVSSAINIVIPWVGRHIITDLEDAVWDKLKSALASIFKFGQPIIETDKITITTNYKPQIIFVFPCNLKPEIFSKELDTLTKTTMEILEKNPNPKAGYKYTFKVEANSWELETGNLP